MERSAHVRHCRCGARMARDHAGRLCTGCTRAARNHLVTAPVVPPEFWQHPTIQRACADWHLGRLIRAFRRHPWHGRPIGQAVAARWIHLTQTQLSRIETGPAVTDLAKLTHWAHVLRVPVDLLWFKVPQPTGEASGAVRKDDLTIRPSGVEGPASPVGGTLLPLVVEGRPVLLPLDGQTVTSSGLGTYLQERATGLGSAQDVAVTATEWDEMSPLSRRALLGRGMAAAALPVFGSGQLQHVAAALDDARRYLDGSVVDYFRRQLSLCKAGDGALGTSSLPVVLGILGAIDGHAREVKPGVRRELLSVGADTAEFAGWLYRDARDLTRALYWHDRAIEWAQEAGDLAMQGYVLLRKAQLAYDEREPLRMLTLSQAVQTGPWQLPQRVQAEAVQQEARAEAMLGGSIDLVQRKLDTARQLLDRPGGAATDSPLGVHYDERLLTMQTAICFTEAGQPRRAVELYAGALTEDTFSPRDYGFFLSWQSASLALAGEPDEAATVGVASARRADHANSHRTRRELGRVLDTLRPWQNRPAVRELAEALQA